MKYNLGLAFLVLTLVSVSSFNLQQANAAGWTTSGNKVIKPDGSSITLKSIAWFGFQTGNYVVHGIWTRNMQELLNVVKTVGFNSIRIPWCNDIVRGTQPNGINYNANPKLQGLNSLQVLDYLIDYCNQIGLYIILDRHRPTQAAQSELWYTSQVSEQVWINDWKTMAERYKNKQNVIAADLHNQPHGSATWGNSSPSTDWNKAAERCGNAILSVAPSWLIIVEGIEHVNSDYYWWGGNLANAKTFPVSLSVPNKIIYSPHDYGAGVYNQPWFNDPSFPNNMPGVWQAHWANLHKQNVAPVWIGEFGGRNTDTSSKEGIWQNYLVDYIKANNLHFSYWCLNPNSGDTGGILFDDWVTLDQNKVNMLKRILN